MPIYQRFFNIDEILLVSIKNKFALPMITHSTKIKRKEMMNMTNLQRLMLEGIDLDQNVLDKLGLDGYKKYEKYLSDIHAIELNHIIVNNKVYNYYSKLISNSPEYYVVRLKMADGNYLDGTYRFMTIQDHGNKRMLFKNLQYQAQNYFKENKIEPAIECLNQEKTEEYQKKKKWINEVHESL